ncbi:cupin domain-containing protein [Amycolatopsis sp. lyj-112]|uniref:cupin domain-containing protein n=1 Tax=Amycolatopsis sp. lyj-112 TaxID=2789288 RepID=UPI0039792AF3
MTDPRAVRGKFFLGPHEEFTILANAAETDGRHDITEAVQSAGSMTPLHKHTRYEERVYVLEGSLTVWLDGDPKTLGPGEYALIQRNVVHAIHAGPDGVRALNTTSPAGFAELIARVATPAELVGPDTEIDAELFARVAAELGDVLLGPPGMTELTA